MALPINLHHLRRRIELKPDKPGYANRCPSCSTPEAAELIAQHPGATSDRDANAARRDAMRNLSVPKRQLAGLAETIASSIEARLADTYFFAGCAGKSCCTAAIVTFSCLMSSRSRLNTLM